MSRSIKRVGIVGAGTMGLGIAQAVALANYQVILCDLSDAILDQAIKRISENLDLAITKGKATLESKSQALTNIILTNELRNVTGDLIIEAIVEDLKIKESLFSKLEANNSENTILASNTSSIPISHIASKLKKPGNVAGLHFFNPAHIMKLVEVISGTDTDPEVLNTLIDFSKEINKIPVVATDSPGFIVNRVARLYYVESLKILEDQAAEVETIDALLENFGFRLGPFKLMDLIGLDTNLAVTKSLYEAFRQNPKFQPSVIQQQKVDQGHLGRKTGTGFYEYD